MNFNRKMIGFIITIMIMKYNKKIALFVLASMTVSTLMPMCVPQSASKWTFNEIIAGVGSIAAVTFGALCWYGAHTQKNKIDKLEKFRKQVKSKVADNLPQTGVDLNKMTQVKEDIKKLKEESEKSSIAEIYDTEYSNIGKDFDEVAKEIENFSTEYNAYEKQLLEKNKNSADSSASTRRFYSVKAASNKSNHICKSLEIHQSDPKLFKTILTLTSGISFIGGAAAGIALAASRISGSGPLK